MIGRSDFGKIVFTGDTDVSNLNIDELGKTLLVFTSILNYY